MWSNRLLVVLGLLACLLLLFHHGVHADLNDPKRPRVDQYRYHHVNFYSYWTAGESENTPLGPIKKCNQKDTKYPYVYEMYEYQSGSKTYLSMNCHSETSQRSGYLYSIFSGLTTNTGKSLQIDSLSKCAIPTGFFWDCYKEPMVINYYTTKKANLANFYSLSRGSNIDAYELLKEACKSEVNAIFDSNGLPRTKYTIFSLLDMSVRKHVGFDRLPGTYDAEGLWLRYSDYKWSYPYHNVLLTTSGGSRLWFSFQYDGDFKFDTQRCRLQDWENLNTDCKNSLFWGVSAQLAKNGDSAECYPLFDSIIVYGHALDAPPPPPPPPSTIAQPLVNNNNAAATTGAAGAGAGGIPAAPAGGPTAQPAPADSSPSTFLQLAAFPLLPHLLHN